MVNIGKSSMSIVGQRDHHVTGVKPYGTAGGCQQSAGFFLLAVWFGLATGLGEVSVRAIQKFFLHQKIFVGPHVVWMAPLADVFLFAIFGFVLSFLGRCLPRLGSLHIAAFVFAFLGFSGPLLWYPRLHTYAALLLAAGLAAQTAHFIAARADAFHMLVRRTTGLMVALVMGLAVGIYGWQELAERRALAQLPPTSTPGAPNVLLIVLDTVRAQNLSLYGYARPTTPQLERLAKTGVVFDRAVSTAPWTLPSHASMFTGHFAHELSTGWESPLDTTYSTLAEVLNMQGHVTAGFVANLLYCTYEDRLNRGFVHYEDFPISLGEIARNSWVNRIIAERLLRTFGNHQPLVRKTAAEINEAFLRWVSHTDQRPFFAFLNYFDAHEPYLPPQPFDLKFGSKRPQYPGVQVGYHYSSAEIQELMDAYDGSIAYLDHHLGLLFDELEKRGLRENTLVIITSDHGEEFREHGVMSHGSSLYVPSLHVPLLVSFPSRLPAGLRVREPVSLRNLPATVIDLLNLKDNTPFPGTSLAWYWDGQRDLSVTYPLVSEVNFAPNQPEWYPVSRGDMKSLVIDRYHYIKDGDGREELYDFENDPWEKRDLADTEEGRGMLTRFRMSLETIVAHGGR